MSHVRKHRRIEDDEESDSKEISNGLSQTVLEPSIFGIQPTNDFVRVVGDFLYSHVGIENIEVNNFVIIFLYF